MNSWYHQQRKKAGSRPKVPTKEDFIRAYQSREEGSTRFQLYELNIRFERLMANENNRGSSTYIHRRR